MNWKALKNVKFASQATMKLPVYSRGRRWGEAPVDMVVVASYNCRRSTISARVPPRRLTDIDSGPANQRHQEGCPVKLDLLYELEAPKPWPDGQRKAEQRVYKEALEQVELADKVGFSTVWMVE